MWRSWIRRTGVVKGTAIVTLAGIATSLALTVSIELLVLGNVAPIAIVLSIVIPALIATPVNATILSLLHKLDAAEEQVRALSMLDPLTEAFNRRCAFELAERELERVRRYGGQFAVLLLDIDHFKEVNDRHGHLAGDAVLCAVSDLCRERSRRTDTFARYGGEEFLLLMPNCDHVQALDMAERLRRGIAELEVSPTGVPLRVTVSIGVAVGEAGSPSVDAVIGAADTALYRAKNLGRDRVSTSEVLDDDGLAAEASLA